MNDTYDRTTLLKALCDWRDTLKEPESPIEELLDHDFLNRHTICLAYYKKSLHITESSYSSAKNAYRYAKFYLKGESFMDEPIPEPLKIALTEARDILETAMRTYLDTELLSLNGFIA